MLLHSAVYSDWYSGLWLHLPGPAKRQVSMLNPFTPSTFYPFHRACKETVSIFNPFPPSTFHHFHRSHFPPFLQSLGLQQLTWNRVTEKHQKQMKYNCHMLVLQQHLVLVVLAPYHHNNHYHITFFPHDHTPCPSMHWVCSPPQHFLLDRHYHDHWHKLGWTWHSPPL